MHSLLFLLSSLAHECNCQRYNRMVELWQAARYADLAHMVYDRVDATELVAVHF